MFNAYSQNRCTSKKTIFPVKLAILSIVRPKTPKITPLERLCRNEEKLSFPAEGDGIFDRTSDAVHREIRNLEINNNSGTFWIPARAPLHGAWPG